MATSRLGPRRPADQTSEAAGGRRAGWALLTTSLGFGVVQLDVSVVNVAIKPIGADLGGYFTHYFETQGFKARGASSTGPVLHVKGSTFIASPSNFRIRRSLSVGGDPYMNIGEMWFRKH